MALAYLTRAVEFTETGYKTKELETQR
jgi:hypothetical protein